MASIVNYNPSSAFDKALFNFDIYAYQNFILSGNVRVSVSDSFTLSDYRALGSSIDSSVYTSLPNGAYAWTQTQLTNIQSILDVYSQFINVQFTLLNQSGLKPDAVGAGNLSDINISMIYRNDQSFAGMSSINYNFYGYTGSELDIVLNYAGFGGGGQFNDTTLGITSYGGFALMHEFGHSLGLSHTFDDNSNVTADYAALLNVGFDQLGFLLNSPASLDKSYFSMMSYDTQYDASGSLVLAYTPMITDVIALTTAYGEGTGTSGSGDDTLTPGNAGYRTYFDTGGKDTVNLSNYSTGAYYNLGVTIQGANHLVGVLMSTADYSQIRAGNDPDSLRWFYGEIENVIGSSAADIIVGNGLDNQITGGGGNDTLTGGGGADTFFVDTGTDSIQDLGLGSDTLDVYAGASAMISMASHWTATSSSYNLGSVTITSNGYSIDLASVTAGNGYTITDTGGSVSFTGSSFSDILNGGAYADILVGGSGNDYLCGGLGNDTLDCGVGTSDYVVYQYARANYSISYLDGVYTLTGLEGTDTISGAEFFQFSDVTLSLDNIFDVTAPMISSFSPNDAATNVDVSSNIAISFNEAIRLGSGTIEIRAGSPTGTLIETYNVANNTSNLSINGATLSINPTNNLSPSTQFYVVLNSGAITDLAGNNFAGTNLYDFTTAVAPLILSGTPAANVLLGNSGNDVLTGFGGIDSMNGGDGSDLYIMTSPTDHTAAEINDMGSSGVDEIRFTSSSAGTLTLFSNDRGIELVTIGTGTAVNPITSGTAALNVNAQNAPNALTIRGNNGVNTITGTHFVDALNGGLGNDIYLISSGNDHLSSEIQDSGGTADVIRFTSTTANDTLTLFSGDTGIEQVAISSSNGSTTGSTALNVNAAEVTTALRITGNNGNNVITGSQAVDTLLGGSGNDTYIVNITPSGTIQDTVTENNNGGTDTIQLVGEYTGLSVSTITLANNIENLDTSMTGSSLINLSGNTLANNLIGNNAANTINGGAGNDRIEGGLGNDFLTGGVGNDSFVFNTLFNGLTNLDAITDFKTSGADRILLSDSIFDLITVSTPTTAGVAMTASDFLSGTNINESSSNGQHLMYNSSTGYLYYDADGIAGNAVPIALIGVSTHPALLASDFLIFA